MKSNEGQSKHSPNTHTLYPCIYIMLYTPSFEYNAINANELNCFRSKMIYLSGVFWTMVPKAENVSVSMSVCVCVCFLVYRFFGRRSSIFTHFPFHYIPSSGGRAVNDFICNIPLAPIAKVSENIAAPKEKESEPRSVRFEREAQKRPQKKSRFEVGTRTKMHWRL